MNIPEDMKGAFEQAIKKAGGQSALARKLSTPAKKVSQQRLWHWFQVKGVCPAEWVLQVEEITGVSRYSLRPDVFGEEPADVSAA
ncbi:DNA-binding transcriptional regulator YdaS, prophage-encoded, Cro superfamily [Azotobacter beijerinckii]|uniref:DNA-binding transcriptional regulator YdaS, prophage-encoded, Cro superfamily n=1 Tax=Azotobacter beijerinckii TaxID=170623 RepID=A0A1H6QJ03_9GAMM|nr:YdaS family helix-turn-helix protein [Azotobacter beijerinckii]SEI41886.1 DNA-binding transcriptional regulator YdaS, prophage-encoded, Cro superfamily [Azotobacter beijerinckii]